MSIMRDVSECSYSGFNPCLCKSFGIFDSEFLVDAVAADEELGHFFNGKFLADKFLP